MRIVQVANFVHDTSGGVRDAVGAGYAKAGHDVMTLRPGARHHVHRVELGRTVVELPGVPLPSSGGYRSLVRRAPVARLVASRRPDVVEVHDTTTLAWLGRLCRHARRDGGARRPRTPRPRARRPRRRAGAHAPGPRRRTAPNVGGFDVACAPSRFAAAVLGVDVGVHAVPLGVDLDAFHPSRRDGIVRRAWPRRVLLVSRLTREKQPTLAVGAVEELRWRGWDVELSSPATARCAPP
jgi:alpha-1,6-mannosyltransferase